MTSSSIKVDADSDRGEREDDDGGARLVPVSRHEDQALPPSVGVTSEDVVIGVRRRVLLPCAVRVDTPGPGVALARPSSVLVRVR